MEQRVGKRTCGRTRGALGTVLGGKVAHGEQTVPDAPDYEVVLTFPPIPAEGRELLLCCFLLHGGLGRGGGRVACFYSLKCTLKAAKSVFFC